MKSDENSGTLPGTFAGTAAPEPVKSVSPRKPYTKPAFEFERAFETMALACGKIQQGSSCKQNKKKS